MRARLFVASSLLVLLAGCGAAKPFDPGAWRSADVWSPGGRSAMVPSLAAAVLHAGASRRDLISLLGKPVETEKTPRWWASRRRYDAYVLRYHWNFLDYETEYLLLVYDEGDRLVTWEKATLQGLIGQFVLR